jgi:hypothetical protein
MVSAAHGDRPKLSNQDVVGFAQLTDLGRNALAARDRVVIGPRFSMSANVPIGTIVLLCIDVHAVYMYVATLGRPRLEYGRDFLQQIFTRDLLFGHGLPFR